MPNGRPPEEERVIIMRATLAVLRLIHERTDGDVTWGMIRLAIRLAQREGRPADVSALAAITGIPRTTIHRKLQQYGVGGRRVGRRYVPTLDEPPLEGDRAYSALRAILLNAVRHLVAVSLMATTWPNWTV